MVVLAASLISKTGKALVSRQFVDMSQIRIEGLLAAFPKLVGSGKQHTYVETENVRYVYQPMEALYLLLVTNKQSNILDDLETLRLLSKLVPDYCPALDEEGICKVAFELIFAFDEVISFGGHKEGVTVAQVKQYLEMESHEERVHQLIVQSKINETKDVMKRKASEIDKSKIDKHRSEKTNLLSIPIRIDNGLSDMASIAGGGLGNNASSFVANSDSDSFAKSKAKSLASAPGKGLGMQLGKNQKATQILESLKAEGEDIMDDIQPILAGPVKTAVVATEPVAISIEERISVTLRKDGGIDNFEVQGTLALIVQKKEDAYIRVQIETGTNKNFQFKTHPNIDKDLHVRENILGLKDPNRPFPTGTPTGILKWRMQSKQESLVPLNINCWPSVSGGETFVNIEYEASRLFDLQNVVISIPLPALRDVPTVNQVDGDWRYDSRRAMLEWSIVLIDNTNRSGSLEFVVPRADVSSFFPVDVKFSASKTYCDIKVSTVNQIQGGNPIKFAGRTQLLVESYQVA